MTAPQRQIPPPIAASTDDAPPEGTSGERLRVRRIPLSGPRGAGGRIDPVALLAAVPAHRRHALWQAPEGAAPTALLGVGAALRLVAPRSDEPATAVAELGAMVRRAFVERIEEAPNPEGLPGADREPWGMGPRAFFTVAFDPTDAFDGAAEAARWSGFAPVEAVVPEILVRCSAAPAGGGEAVLLGTEERLPTLAAELDELMAGSSEPDAPLDAPSDPGPSDLEIEWAAGRHRRAVEAALEALSDPALSKVVLAHGVDVRRRRPFAPAVLLKALRRAYPGCFLFSFRPGPHPPGHTAPVFLGASPERLALVDGGPPGASREGGLRVLSGALAGTAPRGRTPDEARRLGAQLLASTKDRQEHAIVEEMIAEALGPLCSHLERGGEPALEVLDNVQHLYTPVVGTLLLGWTLFDAVAALHPTPAVGGMPRDRAMAAIRILEPRPRGLYAGVVGWVDGAGHGDSAVAIRSALVEGAEEGRAVLYAGGGIVPTSDPDVEVEEIRLKLRAVLSAMKAPRDG